MDEGVISLEETAEQSTKVVVPPWTELRCHICGCAEYATRQEPKKMDPEEYECDSCESYSKGAEQAEKELQALHRTLSEVTEERDSFEQERDALAARVRELVAERDALAQRLEALRSGSVKIMTGATQA